MTGFILNQISLYIAIILVMFMPGHFFISAVFPKNTLSSLEKFILSSGASILITDFLMIILSRFDIIFTQASLISVLLAFSLICFLIDRFKNKERPAIEFSFGFSKKQTVLIILLAFITIFIKTVYLQEGIMPSSTDLGHHMYWAKSFSQTGHIQEYAARDIVSVDGKYMMSGPRNISDFIIGEHLIFSAIAIISGLDFISHFPIIILFLINTLSLFSVFILAFRMFENHPEKRNIAIYSLLLIGPIFAIDPPQAKYVAGGVIGNIIGNLLIPLTFYFYIRFIKEKAASWLLGALFFSMGLFYTHHLSALLFLLSLGAFIILSFLANFKETREFLFGWKKNFFSPIIVSFMIFAAIFVIFIHTPSYLKNSAVDTVVGEIKKVEHTGLTMFQFNDIVGEPRVGLSVIGLFFLVYFFRKNDYKFSLAMLLGWVAIIGLISLTPGIMKLSIPSGRVANFATYPFSILGSFAIVSIFSYAKSFSSDILRSSQQYFFAFFLLILTFIFVSGSSHNNSQYQASKNNSDKIRNTFDASSYLSSKMQRNDNLVSDHIYTAADSWIKLYFMRDYNFPVYRANIDRYENNVDKKEFCTLWMISDPAEEKSRECFDDLGINFVMVNEKTDAPQFSRLPDFSKIYANNDIAVFFRNKTR